MRIKNVFSFLFLSIPHLNNLSETGNKIKNDFKEKETSLINGISIHLLVQGILIS